MNKNKDLTLETSERLLKSFEEIEDKFSQLKIADNKFYQVQQKSGFFNGLVLADIDIENGVFFMSYSSDIKAKSAVSFSVSNDDSELENIKNNSIIKSLKKEEKGEFFTKNQLTVNYNTYNIINKKVSIKMNEINNNLKDLLKSFNNIVFNEVKKQPLNIEEFEHIKFITEQIKHNVQKYSVLNNVLSESAKIFFYVIEYNESKNQDIISKLDNYYSNKNLFDIDAIDNNVQQDEIKEAEMVHKTLGNRPLQNYFNQISNLIDKNENQLENLHKLMASTKLLTLHGLFHEFSFDDNKEDVIDFINDNPKNKILADNKKLILDYINFKTNLLDGDCISCQALTPFLVELTNEIARKESFELETNNNINDIIISHQKSEEILETTQNKEDVVDNAIITEPIIVESKNDIQELKKYIDIQSENIRQDTNKLMKQFEFDFGEDIGINIPKKRGRKQKELEIQ